MGKPNMPPMRRQKIYTEQINTKITLEDKAKAMELRARGVDVGELCRLAISQAIEAALESVRAS